jgi:hypothetical protein
MAGETSQQRQARLQRNRMRTAESRANETPQQRHARLQRNRMRTAESRATETPQQRQARYNKAERETLNPGQTKLINNDKRACKLRVSKFCESEMATKDTHLVL